MKKNECLSWDECLEWFDLFEIVPVETLYDGIWLKEKIRGLYDQESLDWKNHEGYVVRVADSFHYEQFSVNVAKFVHKNHVQTENHWMHSSENESAKNSLSLDLEF